MSIIHKSVETDSILAVAQGWDIGRMGSDWGVTASGDRVSFWRDYG